LKRRFLSSNCPPKLPPVDRRPSIMANLTLTAANVVPSAAATYSRAAAGVAIGAGDIIFLDTDRTFKLSDANAVAPANTVTGIAANSAAVGQPVAAVTADPALAIGGTVTQGEVLVLSATPGKIAPVADLATGYNVVILGVGDASNKVNFRPHAPGIVVA
jgi:hypothetical protein